MRRLLLAALIVAAVLVSSMPAAHAASEVGTVGVVGVLTYQQTGSSSTVHFVASTCVHSWAPQAGPTTPGWSCQPSFSLSDTTPGGSFYNLTGSWVSAGFKRYSMSFSLLDQVVRIGPHAATGTVTAGGRSGTATFQYVAAPGADLDKATWAGTIDYVLS